MHTDWCLQSDACDHSMSSGSPFIVTLHAHHQDRAHLYLIFEFVSGGELLHLLRKQRNSVFTADQCRCS